jgi:hypothetical protein
VHISPQSLIAHLFLSSCSTFLLESNESQNVAEFLDRADCCVGRRCGGGGGALDNYEVCACEQAAEEVSAGTGYGAAVGEFASVADFEGVFEVSLSV